MFDYVEQFFGEPTKEDVIAVYCSVYGVSLFWLLAMCLHMSTYIPSYAIQQVFSGIVLLVMFPLLGLVHLAGFLAGTYRIKSVYGRFSMAITLISFAAMMESMNG